GVVQFDRLAAAIKPIGDDGMADVSHVDSQLMSAPRLGMQADVSVVFESLDDLVEGRGFASISTGRADTHPLAHMGINTHVGFDVVTISIDNTMHDGV